MPNNFGGDQNDDSYLPSKKVMKTKKIPFSAAGLAKIAKEYNKRPISEFKTRNTIIQIARAAKRDAEIGKFSSYYDFGLDNGIDCRKIKNHFEKLGFSFFCVTNYKNRRVECTLCWEHERA